MTDPSLINGEGQVYLGGGVNQQVKGDGENVTVWNIWNAKDGLPLAQQHCEQFGKSVSTEYRHSIITGYYKCIGLGDEEIKTIFEKTIVKNSISNLIKCIREKVILFDDFNSDAKTISLAVAEICSPYWDKMASEFINNIPNFEKLSDKYISNIKTNLGKNKETKVLPYVLIWRSMIMKGWNKDKVPTIKEMPDTLFPKGI